jgi:hypothetical protein
VRTGEDNSGDAESMIKITIEVREINGSVQAKAYATPTITQTTREHQMTKWFMSQFEKLMSDKGASVVDKNEKN